MELNEFENIPDNELETTISTEPVQDNVQGSKTLETSNGKPRPLPTMDFFNSAANTSLSEDEAEKPKEEGDEHKIEKPKGQVTLGKVISGKTTVKLINIFIPAFIVFALQKFGYAAQKQQLRLTREEEEIMSPVVQDCLDYITINFDNPFYALAFVASMIYGAKIWT